MLKNKHDQRSKWLKWPYQRFGNNYRVAMLSTLYLTLSGISISSI